MLLNYTSLYEKDAATKYYQRIGKKLPNELSRKSAYDKLIKYKDNEDVYFSFRSIEKIGINPSSQWNTPNGIYTFPLHQIIYNNPYHSEYEIKNGVIKVPHFLNLPYIYVLEAKGRGIKNLITYTEQEFKEDIITLKNGIQKYNNRFIKSISNSNFLKEFIDKYAFDINLGEEKVKNIFLTEATDIVKAVDLLATWSNMYAKYRNKAGGRLWYVTMALSSILASSLFSPNIWSTLFSKILKYNYVVDCGYGIIHENEPIQAVFFNTSSFNVLEIIENKIATEGVEENEYVRQGNLIWDYQFSKMTYLDALDYANSKKDGWRLPTLAELKKAHTDKIKGFVKTKNQKTTNFNYYYLSGSTHSSNKQNYVSIYDMTKNVSSNVLIDSKNKYYSRLVKEI
jgi:hypothetical protein